MERRTDFEHWRAEKLGYVYFSRLEDLLIEQPNIDGGLFDYLIDISNDHKPAGRYFGVEIKALKNGESPIGEDIKQKYKNIPFPAVLVLFDNKTDDGYYLWIKKPGDHGQLTTTDNIKTKAEELDNASLKKIVAQIKDWYVTKAA